MRELEGKSIFELNREILLTAEELALRGRKYKDISKEAGVQGNSSDEDRLEMEGCHATRASYYCAKAAEELCHILSLETALSK